MENQQIGIAPYGSCAEFARTVYERTCDVVLRKMWFGEGCGLERDDVWREMRFGRREIWRKMWFGKRCGLEKDVVWREMWFGERCSSERDVVWYKSVPYKQKQDVC